KKKLFMPRLRDSQLINSLNVGKQDRSTSAYTRPGQTVRVCRHTSLMKHHGSLLCHGGLLSFKPLTILDAKRKRKDTIRQELPPESFSQIFLQEFFIDKFNFPQDSILLKPSFLIGSNVSFKVLVSFRFCPHQTAFPLLMFMASFTHLCWLKTPNNLSS